MKKILSIFLISAMMFSMFTGVTVFAAVSQATGDGGTIWHKWDFENSSTADSINNARTTGGNLFPTIASDGNGENFGKYTVSTGGAHVIETASTLGVSTDRYAIFEFDFKKDDTTYKEGTTTSASPDVNFYIRDTYTGNASRKVSNYGKTEAADWTHTIIVLDKNLNANSMYTAKTYSLSDGVYTKLNKDMEVMSDNIKYFRIELNAAHNPGKSFYIDNLELMTYGNFYAAINSASSAQNAVNIIDRYSSLGMSGVSSDFYNLAAEDKTTVAAKLLNKGFESDSNAISALQAAMNDMVVVKTYLNWSFEDGTLNDSVNSEPFMQEGGTASLPVVGTDPTDSSNKVAQYTYDGSNNGDAGNIVTFTSVMDTAYTAGEFKYLVYDFKVYGDTDKTFPVYQDLRRQNGASTEAYYSAKLYYAGNQWHRFRGVINTVDGQVSRYKLNGAKWELYEKEALPANFGFYRLSFNESGSALTVYYDDFRVTGYKDVISEIVECSANGIANVLEVYDDIDIVKLPASYASLDDSAKAALGAYIKANTTASTTVDALNEAITLYLSNDELVVLSSDATSTALNALKLSVKKDGVSLAGAKLIVAAYDGTELVSVKVCDVAADGTAADLNVDISSADSVKLMLVNNTTAMVPAVKATAWK